MKTIDQLTKTEKQLLLFLECAAVDHGGLYQSERTNAEDRTMMDLWRDQGFIEHGRVASEHLTPICRVWVRLSVDAENLAHAARAERSARMWTNRGWVTTDEKRLCKYPENVKEHATLSAGEGVERGVEVKTTEDHENRAADRGCCVSTC